MCGEREQVAESIRHSSLTYGNIQQTLALGLLVLRKHDRAETKNTANYTNAQLQAEDHFTSHEIEAFREEANTMLSQFAANLAHPKEKPAFWLPVWQGMVSAFFYSLFLIVIAVIANFGGHDLIDILKSHLK